MPNGFLEGIRLSNIYRPPQYRKVEPPREEIPNFPQQGRVGQIAQQVAGRDPNVTPQMDVVFKPQAGTESEILRQSNLRASPEFELAKEQLGAQYGYRGRQLDIQQQRADAYTFKTQNPNAIIREVGGRMVAINPQNPSQTVDLGDSRFMDEADKLALQQTGRLELEGTRQTGRESLLKTRGEQELEQIGARGIEARRTQEERPELATQQARRIQNKYNILINRRPELRDFVKLDPASGMPTVTPPSKERTGWPGRILGPTSGPTQEQFNEINQFLFGNVEGKTEIAKETETKPTGDARSQAVAELGKIGISNPNESQIQEAIKDLGLQSTVTPKPSPKKSGMQPTIIQPSSGEVKVNPEIAYRMLSDAKLQRLLGELGIRGR